jgi:type II secretory pathway pseudopilin PulG
VSSTSSRPDRRGRLLIAAGLAVLVVIALVAGVAVVALLGAAARTDEGVEELERAQSATGDVSALLRSMAAAAPPSAGETGRPAEGDAPAADPAVARGADVQEAIAALRRAAGNFDAVVDDMGAPWLAPARIAPMLGRQIRAVSTMAGSASVAATETANTLDTLVAQLESPTPDPATRIGAAREARTTVQALRSELDGLDLGPTEALLTPVADARNRFSTELADLDRTLDEVAAALEGVVSFLEGPSRYLVLAANNAEMRAGGGMYLQAGILLVEDGRFILKESFVPTDGLVLDEPGATLDPDVARLWGWMGPDRDVRNANLTPRFDVSALNATELWGTLGRGDVDGVLVIDVRGLRDLLEVIGPVEVATATGARRITAGNVIEELLLRQYERFDARRDRLDRRETLGDTAAAVFGAFNERDWSAVGLVSALQRAGTGRNVLLWSSDPVQQAAWTAIGADGAVSADSVLLAVLNRGANKLDQFLEVAADMSWSDAGDGLRRLTFRIDLTNTAPEGLPPYVAGGPAQGTDLAEAEYRGMVSLTLPRSAGNFTMEGAPLSISGDDGPTRVAAGELRIPRGERRTVTITADVPTGLEAVTVLPSARWPQVRWTAGVRELPARRPAEVDLGDGQG